MMIEQITGNSPSGASVPKADIESSSSFNRMLSEKALAIAERGHGTDGRVVTSADTDSGGGDTTKSVKIGTITSKNPTVSDLLIQNPSLKKDCWNIIFSRQNRDKAYTRIPEGTDIYYNPVSRELLWGDMCEKAAASPAVASVPSRPETDSAGAVQSDKTLENDAGQVASGTGAAGLIETLVDAVRPLIGKSYADVNCYELLVNGLSRMGIRYYGRNGLGNQMVAGARDRGLPMNAYLNGEGLIRFSGSETFRKSFMKVSDPVGQARQVIEEMAAHLEKGSILSFSTESRGHTGIVSNKDGAWTFINSGVMDNPVEAVTTAKGVGEESLAREIENWFQLAARKNESLVITLGKLNQNKLAAYGAGEEQRA